MRESERVWQLPTTDDHIGMMAAGGLFSGCVYATLSIACSTVYVKIVDRSNAAVVAAGVKKKGRNRSGMDSHKIPSGLMTAVGGICRL